MQDETAAEGFESWLVGGVNTSPTARGNTPEFFYLAAVRHLDSKHFLNSEQPTYDHVHFSF